MKHINYQSDFKIIENLSETAPFRFTYYVKRGKEVIAEYNGSRYTGCIVRDGELVVPIDGKSLGIGEVKVKREYFLTDKDFADGICNLVSDDIPTGIELWRGETDGVSEVHVDVPDYYHTIRVGGGGEDLSDYYTKREVDSLIEEKQDVIADLDVIRADAAKGATALQEVPESYATKADLQQAINESIINVIHSYL